MGADPLRRWRDVSSAALYALDPFRDAWLATRVRFALLPEWASRQAIVIDVHHGRVILKGAVALADQAVQAEKTVRAMAGVVSCHTFLRVSAIEPAGCGTVCDGEIHQRVTNALRGDYALRSSSIYVDMVYDGWVSLAGSASDGEADARAFNHAIATSGVRRVSSNVAVGVRDAA
jgi:osmotically-inducible protein OsmY